VSNAFTEWANGSPGKLLYMLVTEPLKSGSVRGTQLRKLSIISMWQGPLLSPCDRGLYYLHVTGDMSQRAEDHVPQLFSESVRFPVRQFRMLNKRVSPIELSSLWSTRVQAESLLIIHPEEHWITRLSRPISANPWHWSGLLQTLDTGQGTCRVPANPSLW